MILKIANLSKFVPFGQFDVARTHDEAKAIVCCICGRKVKKSKAHGSVHVVSEKFSNLVRKFVYSGYYDICQILYVILPVNPSLL